MIEIGPNLSELLQSAGFVVVLVVALIVGAMLA